MSQKVYVLDKNKNPLMPTTRFGHVRILLKQNKARVVSNKPFTIQLLYDGEFETQDVILGIDCGRTNIGAAAIDGEGECLFLADVITRNKEIPNLMKKRAAFRRKHRDMGRRDVRQRRAKSNGTVVQEGQIERCLPQCEEAIICNDIRNKKARFCNRTRPAGWLTPTANQLLQSHISVINYAKKILPVSKVVIELNKFAFMQLDNPNIQKWEYQKGPLYQKGGVDNAVYELQEGKCLFCDGAIEEYHHIVPQSKNGSNTLDNKVGLCEEHHHFVHTEQKWQEKLSKKKKGLNKKYNALSVLNQIIPYLIEEVSAMYPNATFVTTGQDTKRFRDNNGLDKDHCYDAYAIACSILDSVTISITDIYTIKQYRRHDRQACHKENLSRNYYFNGEKVATNRHNAECQTTNSLEEFRTKHSEQDISKLTVKHVPVQYKDMHRTMPGALFLNTNTKEICVLKGSSGKHNGIPNYYVDECLNKHLYNKCIVLQQNQGLRVL